MDHYIWKIVSLKVWYFKLYNYVTFINSWQLCMSSIFIYLISSLFAFEFFITFKSSMYYIENNMCCFTHKSKDSFHW